jgi:rRNA-processing protein EBP2
VCWSLAPGQVAFYQSALSAVVEGRRRLVAQGVPYKRPEDFFCDMLKSDGHMAKVGPRT